MIKSILKELPKETYELDISIPWSEIKASYDKAFGKIASQVEVSGFRKGKAPKKLSEEKVNQKKVYELVVKEVIPKAYGEAVKKHNLSPVTSPKIDIVKAAKGKTWRIKATVVGKPKIQLKNYVQKIKDFKGSKKKIWTPGDDDKEKQEEKPSLDELIDVLLKEIEVELSDMLIDQEKNRLLANFIDQTQKLGLTIEQYLIAKGKTNEQLQEEYRNQAEKNLKLEFALSEIANSENIVVTPQDIDKLLSKVKDEKEKERLRKDSYYLAHLIRQQKTIDYLNSL